MKTILFKAVFALAFGFSALTHAQNLSESFEGNTLPETWKVLNYGSSTAWSQSTTTPQNGLKVARLNGSSTHDDWFIAPKVTIASATDSLHFWARKSSSTATLNVALKASTTGSDSSSFTSIVDSNLDLTNVWTKFSYATNDFLGQNVYFALHSTPSSFATLYLDNVTGPLLFVDPCPPVNDVDLSTETSDGATASWNSNMVAASYDYEVFNVGQGPNGTVLSSGNVTDTFAVLTGLPSISDLEFWIKPNCGSVDSEITGPFTFTTLCGQETEVYSENFDSYIPQCWIEQKGQIDTNTTFTSTSSLWTSDGFANNGTSGAARINVAFTSRRDWLITPSLNLDSISNSEISFFAALTDAGNSNAPDNGNFGDDDKVKIVISTDNGLTWSDTNTLVTFDTANVPSHLGDFYTIDLSSYSGLVKIGFYAESTVSNESNDFSIDNFSWGEAITCLPLSGLTIDSITSSEVFVTVTNPNTSTDVIVEYGEDGFTLGTGTQLNVTSPTFSISGLDAVTEYDFYVRSICAAGDSSFWSFENEFQTECENHESEYNQDFASYIPSCWTEGKGVIADTTVFTSTSSNWAADGFGNVGVTGSARMNIWSTGRFEWLFSPTLNLDSIPNSEISFFAALTPWSGTAQGSFGNDDKFHIVISTDNGVTWSDDNILLTYDTANAPTNTGTYVTLPMGAYSGLVKIGFYAESTVSGGDINVYVDDFKWGEESNCVPVTNISVDSVFSNDAYISWSNDNVVNNFVLEYGENGFTQGTGTTLALTDTFVNISGLDAVTEYDFYIRSICTVGDSSLWTLSNSFTTDCNDLVAAYTQDFATYLPQCWEEAEGVIADTTVFTSLTTSDWTNDGYLNNGSTGAAKINIWSNTKRDWLISPTLDLDSIPNSQITFLAGLTDFANAAVPDNGGFGSDDKVHVVISLDNGTTWSDDNILITFDTNNTPSYTGGYYTASLAAYSGRVKIGFYAESLVSNEDNDFFIDNFNWEEIPSCLPITSATLDSVFASDAHFTFMNDNAVDNFIVEFGTSGFTLGTGTQITSADTNIHLTGLTPVTEYDMYIYNVCSPGDTSAVIVPFTFTTECPIYSTSYTQDFATYIPQCWEEFEGTIEDTTDITGTSSGWNADGFLNNGFSGSARVRVSGTTVNEWLISPSLNLSALPGSHIEFTAGLTDDFSSNAPTNGMGPDDKIQVVVSTDNGLTWSENNVILSFDYLNYPSSNGQYYSIPLSAYTGTVKIGFYAESTVSNEGNDFFIDNFKWELAPTCGQISLIEIDTTTGTEADLSWNTPVGASSFIIEYGIPGFTLGTGTILTSSTNDVSISGLDALTTYEVYVKSVCAPGDTSDISLTTYFTTECLVNSAYFVEDFATYIPLCWEEAAGTLGATSTTFTNATSSSWGSDGFLNNGTSGAARINIFGTGPDEWLISESLDLNAKPNSQIEFDAGLTDWSNSNAPDNGSFGVDDKVVVVISTDNGATWAEANALLTFNQSNTPTPLGNHYTVPLTTYSGIVKIGFYAESTVSNEDNDFFIDNFEWSEATACAPTDLFTIEDVSANEATISWNNANGVSDYIIEYGEAGFELGTGTTVMATDTFKTITGLSATTSYQAYVKAVCSTTDTASYNSSIWFTTECEILSLNSLEEFGTYLPNCWSEGKGIISDSTVFTSATSSSWTGDGYLNVGSTGSARLNIFGTGTREWLISPSIDLTAGPRQIEFDAGITDFSGSGPDAFGSDDTLKVVISLDNGITWSNTNVLKTFDDTDTLFNAGNHYIIPVHMYTGQVKIGFYGTSTVSNTDYNVYIDNFEIKERDITSNDLKIQSVLAPATVCIGESNPIFVTLNNVGLNPVDSFNLDVVITGPTAFDNNNQMYIQTILLNSFTPIEVLNTSGFAAGVYSGTAIVSNPFDTIPENDTVSFDFEIVDNPNINAGSDVTICLGDAYVLNATGGTSYVWDGGLTNGTSVSPTVDTEYYVTGMNAAGCSNVDTVKVSVVSGISVSIVTFGGDLASTGVFAAYEWTLNGVVVGTGSQITPTENGTYTLTVTNSTGCQASDDYVVTGIGLEEVDAVNVSVYPNPTVDVLNIESKDEVHSISIVDVQGKEVIRLDKLTSKSINVSELAQGYYILKATVNGTQFQTKFNKL